jgi:hypothetical protein
MGRWVDVYDTLYDGGKIQTKFLLSQGCQVLEKLFFTDGCGYEILYYLCVLFHSLKVEPSPKDW